MTNTKQPDWEKKFNNIINHVFIAGESYINEEVIKDFISQNFISKEELKEKCKPYHCWEWSGGQESCKHCKTLRHDL